MKNRSEIGIRKNRTSLRCFFNRFSTILIPAESQKKCKNLLLFFFWFFSFSTCSRPLIFHDFCIHFGITFCSISIPKSFQNLIKKLLTKLNDFCFDFVSIFHGFEAPCSSQVGSSWRQVGHHCLEAPFGALEAPLGALGRHLGSKMLPRRPPELPDPPDLHFNRFSNHLWKEFEENFFVFSELQSF